MKFMKSITLLLNKGVTKFEIPFSVFRFSDKSLKVTIDDVDRLSKLKQKRNAFPSVFDVDIVWYGSSVEDLVVIGQLVEILDHFGFSEDRIRLEVCSPMYARYDRVMHENKSDGFGLLAFTKMLKATGVKNFLLRDPHSVVYINLLAGCNVEITDTSDELLADGLFPTTQEYKDVSFKNIVAPDAGASKRLGGVDVVCEKERDPETGVIKRIYVKESLKDVSEYSYLTIVDDICERGGTFFGVEKALRKDKFEGKLNLFVTHGVFPDGTDFTELFNTFDRITVGIVDLNTFIRLANGCKDMSKLHVRSIFMPLNY